MTYLYSAFGLLLESNLPIPGPQPMATNLPADVSVHLGEKPAWIALDPEPQTEPYYSSPYLGERSEPALRVWRLRGGAFHRLLYSDATQFIVDSAGTQVWATWPPGLTLEDTATYLLGPILGLVLRLRGTVCLHASAVAIANQAVVLLGPAGAGKSTTAAGFAQLGYPVFSDDVVPLSEDAAQFFVLPAYPHLRLWPDSVDSLFGSAEALPRLTPTWDKRYLDLLRDAGSFQRERLPLAAIYFLGERSAEPSAPFVEPLPPRDAVMTLVANTYVNYLLDRDMRAREFEMLSRVVRLIPVRRVRPHSDSAALQRLCQVIAGDFRALTPPVIQRGEEG